MIAAKLIAVATLAMMTTDSCEEQEKKQKEAIDTTMECDVRSQHLMPKEEMLSVVTDGSSVLCGVRKKDNKAVCWYWKSCP